MYLLHSWFMCVCLKSIYTSLPLYHIVNSLTSQTSLVEARQTVHPLTYAKISQSLLALYSSKVIYCVHERLIVWNEVPIIYVFNIYMIGTYRSCTLRTLVYNRLNFAHYLFGMPFVLSAASIILLLFHNTSVCSFALDFVWQPAVTLCNFIRQ